MRIIKNLTDISLKTDIHDYLNWLNANYGISKATSFYQLPATTPFIAHKQRMTRMKN
jgi:hypothetical protein